MYDTNHKDSFWKRNYFSFKTDFVFKHQINYDCAMIPLFKANYVIINVASRNFLNNLLYYSNFN